MPLIPGTSIGPYVIAEKIGAGGMGEVFRAQDVNLGRAAAIKVLPASLAGDPERLARFEREAQTLAALNHPNIAQVFGLEKGSGEFRAIAMEFVDGPTLADRIAGPMPLDDAIPIALQIAEALESAHDHGIVHRDLKPANIKVRPDGTVKVLDFGLAKAMLSATEGTSGAISNSPTITSPGVTHAGVILGTAAYMSPEQAKGRVVDRRADIWAFGCVLFEMLSGKRAFAGGDVSELIVSILRDDPPWDALPAAAHRCRADRVDRTGSPCRGDLVHRPGDAASLRHDCDDRVRARRAGRVPVVVASPGGSRVANPAARRARYRPADAVGGEHGAVPRRQDGGLYRTAAHHHLAHGPLRSPPR
jgi:serine/threonine protein kinase